MSPANAIPIGETVHTFNDVLNGRNALGRKIVDFPEGARSFFDLKDVPDDLLTAEVRRRPISGTSE
jgi:hypothetical protein